jgi:hypothetical protein
MGKRWARDEWKKWIAETEMEGETMASGPFGTAINCIDGRAQAPIADWVKMHCHVSYVDTVTTAGADGVLAQGPRELVELIRQNVLISVNAHQSRVVAIAGHHECAANAVSSEEHRRDIAQAVQVVRDWGLPVRVVGLWVNDWWQVEVVADAQPGAR